MSSHEKMLIDQLQALRAAGNLTDATKVLQILAEHQKHKQGQTAPMPTDVEKLEEYAAKYPYMGPPEAGDHFYGWPLSKLIDKVFPAAKIFERAKITADLKMKHNLFGMSQSQAQAPAPPRPYTYEERLAMRMGWGRIEESKWAPDFEHVDIHKVGDLIHVWVITSEGKSVVLEDEAPLFPSDAFVTKLNILKG